MVSRESHGCYSDTGGGRAAPRARRSGAVAADPATGSLRKPQRVRFDDPNIPTGELGEWVEVQNDEGKVALRFKVDLLDAKLAGVLRVGKRVSPMVLAKFGITVENESCEDLAWNPRTPGFWVGTKKRIEKMPTYGWVRVDTDYSEMLFVPYKGRFYKAEEEELKSLYLQIENKFAGRLPQEFPEQVSAGETAYGEFLIKVMDVLGIDASPPVGPEGDGNLPLVIGGYQSWARINLGSAASWYEKFIGDPSDPSTLPPHLRP